MHVFSIQQSFLRDVRATAAIEYGVLAGVVAASSAYAINLISTQINAIFHTVNIALG